MRALIEILARRARRAELVALCEKLDAEHGYDLWDPDTGQDVSTEPHFTGAVIARELVELIGEVRADMQQDFYRAVKEGEYSVCWEQEVAKNAREHLVCSADEQDADLPAEVGYTDDTITVRLINASMARGDHIPCRKCHYPKSGHLYVDGGLVCRAGPHTSGPAFHQPAPGHPTYEPQY